MRSRYRCETLGQISQWRKSPTIGRGASNPIGVFIGTQPSNMIEDDLFGNDPLHY